MLSRQSAHEQYTVADITQMCTREKSDLELLQRAAQLEVLPTRWRDYFQENKSSSG